MIAYPWGALVTGFMLTMAGFFTLARHFLLEPLCQHYPKAPLFVRHGIFLFGSVLIFLGLQFLWVYFADQPNTIPPQPGPSIQFLSAAIMLYTGMLWGSMLRHKIDAEINDKVTSFSVNENEFIRLLKEL